MVLGSNSTDDAARCSIGPFIDVDGTLLVLELGIDITSRKEVERDLLRSRLNWKRVADQTARGLTQTVALLRDEIIQRTKTEDALRTSEERYAWRSQVQTTVFRTGSRVGNMYFSSWQKSMLGYSDHEISDDVREWKSVNT